ncbi:MAG: hypothetical protein NXI24_16520 [bacterium]|nr:hypothetical protein [bacterium]
MELKHFGRLLRKAAPAEAGRDLLRDGTRVLDVAIEKRVVMRNATIVQGVRARTTMRGNPGYIPKRNRIPTESENQSGKAGETQSRRHTCQNNAQNHTS